MALPALNRELHTRVAESVVELRRCVPRRPRGLLFRDEHGYRRWHTCADPEGETFWAKGIGAGAADVAVPLEALLRRVYLRYLAVVGPYGTGELSAVWRTAPPLQWSEKLRWGELVRGPADDLDDE